MEDQIYTSIAREIVAEADEQEKKLVREWVKEGNNRLIYNALKEQLTSGDSGNNSQKEVLDRIRSRINQEDSEFGFETRSRMALSRWLKVAAAVVLVAGAGWLVSQKISTPAQEIASNVTIEKSNPTGQKSSFVLSDGTLVKLNAESKLVFAENFDDKKREVFLEGEAFFDVKKDPARPFVVHTGQLSTTALGTSFNIEAYNGESPIKVSLVTGKVKVAHMDSSIDDLLLDPDEMATFDIGQKRLSRESFDPELVLAWKNQTLYFKDAGLANMTKTLERWYGVSIEVSGKKPIETSFTGKFKDKSLEYVLDVLSQNQQNFAYSISGKKIKIIKN